MHFENLLWPLSLAVLLILLFSRCTPVTEGHECVPPKAFGGGHVTLRNFFSFQASVISMWILPSVQNIAMVILT